MDDFCSEVAELHGLLVRQFIDGVCLLDDLGVGGHESVDIRPYFQHFGIEGCGKDRSGVIASATSQIGDVARVTVLCNEAGDKGDAGKVGESSGHEPVGKFRVEISFALLLFRLDKRACIQPLGATDEHCHNVRAEAFAIAYDCILGLVTEVMDEIHTVIDRPELLKKTVYLAGQFFTVLWIGDDGIYHPVMAVHHPVELRPPVLVAFQCHPRRGKKLVGNAAQGTDHHDDRLVPGLLLYNLLQT